jgi:hypothetical protein
MENYEKRLKDIISSRNTPLVDIDVMLKYFPELKESEDEIFKELLYNLIVSNNHTSSSKEIFSVYGKTKEDCIAWLKKQGEQEPTWNEKIKGLDELETYILSLVPDRSLEAIKVDAKSIRYIINKEQKSVWSEEDERTYNEILDFFLGDIGSRCVTIDKQRHFGYWLKSIKER